MKAVYIMSSPRGGSTLLSLVLGRHSEITNLGEVSFIPKLLSLNELCTCGEQLNKCACWLEVFDRLAEDTGVNMRVTPYKLHLDDVMKHKSGTGKIDSSYQRPWRVLRAKIRGGLDDFLLRFQSRGEEYFTLPSVLKGASNTISLYQAAASTWHKSAIVDASKLPRKAVHLYKKAPDKVRIIHLTRDSRGVAASRKASNLDLRHSVQRWNYYHSLAKSLIEKWILPEHVKRLKYEDFVNDPESHLRSICEWLDITYCEQMLDFTQTVESHSAGGNPTRFNFAEGIRPVDERWRTLLSEEELQIVDDVCGDLSRKMGY